MSGLKRDGRSKDIDFSVGSDHESQDTDSGTEDLRPTGFPSDYTIEEGVRTESNAPKRRRVQTEDSDSDDQLITEREKGASDSSPTSPADTVDSQDEFKVTESEDQLLEQSASQQERWAVAVSNAQQGIIPAKSSVPSPSFSSEKKVTKSAAHVASPKSSTQRSQFTGINPSLAQPSFNPKRSPSGHGTRINALEQSVLTLRRKCESLSAEKHELEKSVDELLQAQVVSARKCATLKTRVDRLFQRLN